MKSYKKAFKVLKEKMLSGITDNTRLFFEMGRQVHAVRDAIERDGVTSSDKHGNPTAPSIYTAINMIQDSLGDEAKSYSYWSWAATSHTMFNRAQKKILCDNAVTWKDVGCLTSKRYAKNWMLVIAEIESGKRKRPYHLYRAKYSPRNPETCDKRNASASENEVTLSLTMEPDRVTTTVAHFCSRYKMTAGPAECRGAILEALRIAGLE